MASDTQTHRERARQLRPRERTGLPALLRRPQYKLLALALAVVAWTYVQGDEVHETRIKAPVEWQLPPELISPEQLPASISLTVRGTRAATRRAREVEVVLPVDISDIGVGEHALAFDDFAPRNLPPGVEVLGTSPASVRFALDEVADRKVSIRPVLVGEPEGGLVDEVILEPQVVEVVGPRTVVEQLREVDTVPIDVSTLAGDTEIAVDLDLPRTVRLADGGTRPVAHVRVVSRAGLRQIRAPVVVWGDAGWVVSPAEVTISLQGPTADLRRIDPQEVIAVVHLPDDAADPRYEAGYGAREGARLRVLHPGGERVEVEVVTPAGVEVVRR